MSGTTGTSGSDNLNGGSGDDSIHGGAGDDKISGGSGSDTLDGGSGSDTLNGGSGDDILIYRLSENGGANDVYTGGSGWDVIRIMLTTAEWMNNSVVQSELTRYYTHLQTVKRNANTGEVSNGGASDFTFNFGGGATLKVQMMEELEVFVDNVMIDLDRPYVDGGLFTGAAKEDTTLSAAGTITFVDLDVTDTHTVAVNPLAGAIGSLSATISNQAYGDGQGVVSWTYALNNAAAQYLAAGQTKTEVFTVVITDSDGLAVAQTVTVTITGSNDAPVISGTQVVAAIAETDTTLSATGTLNVVDVDTADTVTMSVDSVAVDASSTFSGTNPLGNAALKAMMAVTGGALAADPGAGSNFNWTFTSGSSGDGAFNFLDTGETLVLKFTIKATDNSGASLSDTKVVTITIIGADDQPTLAAVTAATVAEDRLASTTTDSGLSGTLVGADVDGETLTYGISGGTVVGTVSTLVGTYGTLTVDTATGAYSYAKNAAAIEALDDGEIFEDNFTMTVSDGDDADVTQNFKVTVTGADDQPTLAAVTAATVAEDRLASTTTDSGLSGTLVGADVDGETLTYGISGGTVVGTVSTLVGTYGTLTVDTATGAYSYAKNAAAIEALDDGEIFEDNFTMTVSDGDDADVTQNFKVTVTGADDQPTLAAVTAATVAEDRLASTTTDSGLSGTLVGADVDGETLTYGISGGTVVGTVSTLVGTYGTLTVDTATGAYSYAKNAAAIEALDDGEIFEDNFTMTVSDGDDADVTQNFKVTVTGADDQPTLAAVTAATVAEDRLASTTTDSGLSGTLVGADVDGETLTYGISGGTVVGTVSTLVGTYGTLTVDTATGAYSYAKNAAAIEALDDGEIFEDNFTMTVSDGDDADVTQNFKVTVTGADDQPTLAAVTAATVAEDRLASTTTDSGLSGTLVGADVDGETLTYGISGGTVVGTVSTLVGTYGTLTVDTATGAYSYAKNAAAIEALDDGEIFEDNFTMTVSDGDDADVTQNFKVTVTGADDQPTLAAVTAATVAEDRLASTTTDSGLSGTLVGADVDGETLTYGISGGTVVGTVSTLVGTYGTLTVDTATGAYSYAKNAAAIEALDDGEIFEDNFTMTVSDGDDADVTQNFKVTVTGADDQPTLAAVTAATVAEDRLASTTTDSGLSGTLVGADVDGETLTYGISGGTVVGTVSTLVGTYGTLTVDTATGAYSYAKNAAAIEALDDGEIFEDNFTMTVSDGDDADVTQNFKVTVTGADDQPTLAAVTAATVAEDRLASTTTDSGLSGTLVGADVDGETLTYGISGGTVVGTVSTLVGTYGTLTVDTATGAYSYAKNAAAIEALDDGEIFEDNFTMTVSDGDDADVTQNFKVTVTGADDQPTLAAVTAATVAEDRLASTTTDSGLSGTLVGADVDGETLTYGISGGTVVGTVSTLVGTYGTLTVDTATGAYSYAKNAAAIEALDDGEIFEDNFTMTVSDGDDADVTQNFKVTVTGADDQPTLAAVTAATVAEDRLASTTTDSGLSGTLVGADVDGETLTYGISGGTVVGTVSTLVGTYGTLTVDTATGAYSYAKNAAAIEALDDGEIFEDNFTMTVSDGDDADVTQNFKVTVTGADDQPTLAAVTAATVAEDRLASTTTDSGLSGTLVGADVDGETLTYGISGGTVVGTVSTLVGTYGTLTVDTATGAYSYAKNAAAIEALDDGEIFEDNFTMTVSDGDDADVTQNFKVTVTGADDQPTLAAVTAATVAEDRLASTTTDSGLSGTLVGADVDGETLTYGISGGTVVGTVSTLVGTYGTLTVDTATGAYSYAKNAAAIEALDDGEIFEDNFTMTVSDGDDADVTQNFKVTVTGADDQPTLAAVTAATVAEDRLASTTTDSGLSGTLVGADVDGETLTYGISGGTVVGTVSTLVGTYGTLTVDTATGAYSYAKNAAAIEALDDGEIFEDNFTMTVSDGDDADVTQNFKVTVTGADDQPTLAAVTAATVAEDRLASTTTDSGLSGTLVGADVDGETLTYGISGGTVVGTVSTLVGTYGTLTVDTATGAYSYAKNAAAIEALDDGEIFEDNFTMTVSDGDDADVTQNFKVTVTGADDQPTLAAVTAATVAEDRLASTTTDSGLSGTLVGADVDGETLTYGISGGTVVGTVSTLVGTYGTLTVDTATGAYSYAKNAAAIEALDDGEIFEDNFTMTVSDGDDADVTQNFKVTVTGADDQPTLAAVTAATVAEDRLASTTTDSGLSGTLVGADVDGETLTYGISGGTVVGTVSTLVGTYGTLTVDTATGAYSYAKNAAAIEALDDGEIFEDNFTMTVSDGDDADVTQNFKVTVTGADDQPTLAAVTAATVAEDRLASTTTDSGLSGTLVGADVDGETLTYGISGGTVVGTVSTLVGTYGTLTVDTATGAYSYAKNAAAIEALDDGEIFEDNFTMTVSDGDDADVTQNFKVTVTGADDQPTLAAVTAATVAEDRLASTTTDSGLSGTLVGADVDGETLTYGISGGTVVGTVSTLVGTYGTLTVDTATGAYSYAKNAAAIEALDDGEIFEDNFTMTVSDGDDADVTQNFKVTVTGADDQPTLAAVTAATVAEDRLASTTTDSGLSGTLVGADVDGETLTYGISGGTVVGTVSTLVGTYGTLTVDTATGAYSYAKNAAAIEALDDGEIFEDNFTMTVSDGDDADVTQNFKVTVTGADDQPTLAAVTAATVAEDRLASTTTDSGLSGTLVGADVDGETLTYGISGGTVVGTVSTLVGTYGTLTVDTATGAYSYAKNAAAIEALDDGEIFEDNFTMTVSDGDDADVTQNFKVTVTGADDQPTLAAVTAATVAEDRLASTTTDSGLSGTLVGADVDGETLTYGISGGTVVGTVSTLVGTYGTLTVDTATGAYSYAKNAAAIEALDDGEIFEDNFTMTVSDGDDADVTQNFKVTVTGADDQPTLAAVTAATVAEDRLASTTTDSGLSGTLVGADVDGETLTYGISGGTVVGTVSTLVGTYGTLTVDTATGAYSYAKNAAAIEALDDGEIFEDNFTMTVSDGDDADVTQNFKVTVTGADDQPTLAAVTAATVAEDRLASTTTDSGLSGTLVGADVDGETLTYGISGGTVVGTVSTLVGTYGTLTVDTATGAYSYAKNAAAIEALDDGEIFEDNFTMTVSDGDDADVTQNFKVTVTGADDQPTLAAVTAATVAEDRLASTTTDSGLSGTLVGADVDGETLTYGISGGTVVGTVSTLVGTYGTLTVDTATGAYSYAKNAAAIEALDDGEIFEDNFTMTVSDGDDADVTQNFKVTVTGADDQPTLAAVTAATVAEDRLASTTTDSGLSGTLVGADVDGETLTYGISGGTVVGTVSTLVGTYGTLTVDTATGAYSYAKNAAAIEALDDGEIFEDNFTMTVSDGDDADVTQNFKVTVTGADDQPTLAAVTSGSVTEIDQSSSTTDSNLSGNLVGADVDDETLTYGISGGTVVGTVSTLVGTYGTLTVNTSTGAYSYAKNTAAIEALSAGATPSDVFTFTVSDGDDVLVTQTYTVNLTGANDTPTVTSFANGAVTEDATSPNLSTTVSVNFNDVDLTDLLGYSFVKTSGTLGGTLTAPVANDSGTGAAGSVSYTYSVANANTQSLAAGQQVTETFTITANDGNGGQVSQLVTVTITGTNDAPVLNAAATPVLNSVNTGSGAPTGIVGTLVSSLVDLNPPAGGHDNVTDVDSGAVTGIALTATAGSGTWYYSLNNGTNWTAVGAVSNTSALLLAADAGTRLFFQSTTAGTVSNAITFRAWDQTSGTAGTKVTTATNGNQTAFSTATDTANITVTAADTTPPFLSSITSTGLSSGSGSTGTATFVFSEAVINFDLTDVSIDNPGRVSLSNLTTTDSITWTATMTRGANGSFTFTIATNKYNDLAGNANTTSYTSGNLQPAGVAGEPINLALSDPADHVGLVTVTISAVPAGWTFSAGTDNGDGTWTIQTDDPRTLTVTTPADFAGAVVLNMLLSWTMPDGGTGHMAIANNVEAFAPGNPIFAVSDDDHLTGSSGADLFVFAQPIAHNKIYSFDAAADKIDLIGFGGVNGFADLAIADDGNGNAVITLGSGSTITVLGVSAASLTAANFEFNLEPTTTNAGTMTIGDGAILPLGGIVDNSGTIALESSGSQTMLQVLVESLTLQGGGQLLMSDNGGNTIFAADPSATLMNVDNLISGAGQIGAGSMTLVNHGSIVANGTNALRVDTGANTVLNTGTLAATGLGGLLVASALAHSGDLHVASSAMTLEGAVSGGGSATLEGAGSMLSFGAAADVHVGFTASAAGTLVLGAAGGFGGTVAGLDGNDSIDFSGIDFAAGVTVSYTANAGGFGGTLAVSDGTNSAHVELIGHYDAAGFQAAAGADGGTTVGTGMAPLSAALVGTAGDDVLTGTAGNDLFVGGAGSDLLTGGDGIDTFVFRGSDLGAVDTVTDFAVGAGGDRIGLALSLDGYDGSNLGDYLSLTETGGGTMVGIDLDGAGTAYTMQDLLLLQGVTGLDLATLMNQIDPPSHG